MTERLVTEITSIVETTDSVSEIKQEYLRRLTEGLLTRDENPQTHYCVYFAGFSPEDREVFIGHHKKSGLWLFNGGHIDKGETPTEALRREIGEEWGNPNMPEDAVGKPELLTITKIDNPKQTCKTHYDIWHFIWLDKNTFNPDPEKLAKEFHETRWITLDEAKKLITDPSTLEAIEYLEK
ncbi:MAG: NUDIX domain-containing protein [Candidatus Woesebacteria bacterium]|nr:MAG: NUDIX domain-containing protein [Candidatus Woesebacteria bacterium]